MVTTDVGGDLVPNSVSRQYALVACMVVFSRDERSVSGAHGGVNVDGGGYKGGYHGSTSPMILRCLFSFQRGGLHELFLDRLASIFHVHCLREPRRSDELDSRPDHRVARCGNTQPSAGTSPAVNVPGLLVGADVLGSTRRPSSTLPTCSGKGSREGQDDGEWSYGVSGLGTVLAFAAWGRQ